MRIAMIGPFALAPKGTVRMRALPLARELAARGHAVLIAMPLLDAPQEAGRRWEEDGVTLEYVALKPWVRALGHLLVAVRLVAAALRWQPDVVHCFKPKGHSGLAGWALWRLQRLRLYRGRLIVDEDDWEGLGGWNDREPSAVRRRLFAWQERWGLRRCDAITVASRALETLVWSLGVRPERVCYLPNGFVPRRVGDRQAVRAAHAFGDRPVVLLYTRFFEFDVGRVVHVFARIGQALPEVRFLVVGKGLFEQDDARFDRLVAEAGLGRRVIRVGWAPEDALPDYFAAADVALYPYDDTLINRCKCSVKLIDLLAAGVPVVADAVGQNGEYIRHGETGWLVPAGDVAAMADAAVRLLTDPTAREAIGQAAADDMRETYPMSHLAERLLAAYAVGALPQSGV